ncbi:MAG: polysaccharide deacetylase family protein [Balneolaceae bacterium]
MSTAGKDPHIKILMYHRVVDHPVGSDTNWFYVTSDQFKRQMSLINRLGFTTITFIDYQLYLKGELSLPAKPIIITFDDGYLDTYDVATPILLEFGMKAVVFVMGDRRHLRASWDEAGDHDICPLMSDDQFRTLRNYGFEIGAHSMNHSDLSSLTNREIFHEVDTSKREIESVIGEPVHTFAYPYGRLDERVQKIVELAGFSFACGVFSGSPSFGKSVFDFRRIAINRNHSLAHVLIRLLTPFEHLEWLYYRFKMSIQRTETPALHIPNHVNQADQDI